MTILDNTGNVGIGTTGPTSKLTVAGSGVTNDTQWLILSDPQKTSGGAGSAGSVLIGQSGAYLRFKLEEMPTW